MLSRLFFLSDNNKNHSLELDGLRGLAVILVLLSHTSNENLMFHEYLNFEKTGKVGVYLFFVLSAYLLDLQIAKALKANKTSFAYWKNYLRKRFLRIYPLFFIALVTYGVFSIFFIETPIDKPSDIAKHILLLSGESVFWSIAVEFKFYIVSPIIMWVCHKHLKWRLKHILLFFTLLVSMVVVVESIFALPQISTFKFFPVFLVGTFIAILEVSDHKEFLRKTPSVIYDLLGVCSLLIIILSFPYYFNLITGIQINFHHPNFFLPYGLIWGVFLMAARYSKGLIGKLLRWSVLRFMGKISYSIYLFHMLILIVFINIDLGISQSLIIYSFFIITLLVSIISYLVFEVPLNMLKIPDIRIVRTYAAEKLRPVFNNYLN